MITERQTKELKEVDRLFTSVENLSSNIRTFLTDKITRIHYNIDGSIDDDGEEALSNIKENLKILNERFL